METSTTVKKGNEKRHLGIAVLVLAVLVVLSFVACLTYSLPCPVNPLGCIP